MPAVTADSSDLVPGSEGTTLDLSENAFISDTLKVNNQTTTTSLLVTGPVRFDNSTLNDFYVHANLERGLGVFWNVDYGQGATTFLNYGQYGPGGFAFYNCNGLQDPTKIVNFDNTGKIQCNSLTVSNSVTCGTVNCTSVVDSGTVQCAGLTSTGNIGVGTNSVTCGALNCSSLVDSGTVQCAGLTSNGNIDAKTNSIT